ncbi:hypothetical protein V5O48_008412 [Marasmius crinis-equi]|uniref:Cytochrome P450 n=1 Tax=Marasmius crinis-equi TaxID=585013 RepID=A0ABR3FE74_9AGAR
MHGDGAHEDHKRHRRIMNPAFGLAEAKALVPVFSAAACSLSNKWKDLLLESKDQSEILSIPGWVSRATLDAIGHAGFDYDFGAMENQDNRLASAYHNLFADIFAPPSDTQLISNTIVSALMPIRFMIWLLEHKSKSNPKLAHGRMMRETSREVAREVVARAEGSSGQEGRLKDVMSLLGES